MKNKLPIRPGDAKRIHDEFYRPDLLTAENDAPPELKRTERPAGGGKDKGKTDLPRLGTGRPK